jgi:hypothetical protein
MFILTRKDHRTVKTRAALAVIALATLTGCAGQEAIQTAAPVDGEAALETVISQVYGTPAQRAAGQELSWLTSQTAIAACARPKGAVYTVPAWTPSGQVTSPAPGDLLGFAPQRVDFGVANRIETLAKHGQPVNAGLAAAVDKDAWFSAVGSCQDAAQAGEKLTVPAGQEALEGKLVDALTAAQNAAAPNLAAEYAACMKSAGIDANDLSETYIKVEQAFPVASSDKPTDPTRLPGWDTAVAFEKTAAAADWNCRSGQRAEVVAASADEIAAFAADNATALTEVAAGWAKLPLLARAQRVKAAK